MALAENLNRAIQNGDEELVRKLVGEGAAMDHLLGMRGTALCAALSARQSSIASYLIDAGCGVNVEDYDREPPLYLAISKECFDVVKKLINHPQCQLNKSDPLTNTPPLCLAVSCGFQDVVKWFIDAGADLNVRRGSESYTPLHCAIEAKNYPIINMLIMGNCSLYIHNNNGHLPIHMAARYNDIQVLKCILSKWTTLPPDFEEQTIEKCALPFELNKHMTNIWAIVNFKSKMRDRTPLEVALMNGNIHFAILLLKCGADPNTKDPHDRAIKATPLCLASYLYCSGKCDIQFLRWLLDADAHVNDSSVGHRPEVAEGHNNAREETALMIAAKENNVELIRLLVEYGCDINHQDVRQGPAGYKLPITYAIENSAFDAARYFAKECKISSFHMKEITRAMANIHHKEISNIIDILVARGIDVDFSEYNFSAFNEAIYCDNIIMVKSLLQHGASVNGVGNLTPPIHVCAEAGSTEIARILLSSGADINMTYHGEKPLHFALDYNDEEHIELCYFLLESQADIPEDIQLMVNESGANVNENANKNKTVHNDDSDSDSDSSMESIGNHNLPNAIKEDPRLLEVIQQLILSPKPLYKLCIQSLRSQLTKNNISYNVLSDLPLPKKLQDAIAYRG